MNKKLMMFMLAGIFGVMLVSAGLVSYLSNTRQTNINVESPIAIDAFEGDVSPAYGGEIQIISTGLTNLADAQIKGKIKVVITNTGITLEDFETLTASIEEDRLGMDLNTMNGLDMTTTEGFIESIDNTVDNELTFITTERTFEIGETWDASIALGFKSNVKGNYNVAVTIIPLA